MRYLLSRSRGFTLVELLVVIAIIGVLATGLIVLINPVKMIEAAHDTQRKNDLAEIQHMLQLYYQDFGKYPSNDLNHYICVGSPCTGWGWGNAWLSSWNIPQYMTSMPKDPMSGSGYSYMYVASPTGDSYQLYARMENWQNDSHTCTANQDVTCSSASTFKCTTSGQVCNYGVSSPNVSP